MQTEEAFKALCDIIARLRAPDGCPWDREQTPKSLCPDLVEETYECVEAINEKESGHIKEELGDLFLVVTMLSYMHQQEGAFTIAQVLETVSEKLIRRHPHVFAGLEVSGTAEVLDNWAKIKVEKEGRKPKDSILDKVKTGLPPLERVFALQKAAAKTGYDWDDVSGVIKKTEEELQEVKDALDSGPEQLEEELGDLLLMVVNLCRFLKTDPSIALMKASSKFIRRFSHIEKRMKESGAEMKKENVRLMDSFWNEAKSMERAL